MGGLPEKVQIQNQKLIYNFDSGFSVSILKIHDRDFRFFWKSFLFYRNSKLYFFCQK